MDVGAFLPVKIIHAATELSNGSRPSSIAALRRVDKVCLAIGVFDGVHLGHQQIIRQTIVDARQHDAVALVLTFDRHPNAVVAPDCTAHSLPLAWPAKRVRRCSMSWSRTAR